MEDQKNSPIPVLQNEVATSGGNPAPTQTQRAFAVFLKLIAAIPENSPLRNRSGMVRPSYPGAQSFFDANRLWHDIASIAHVAVEHLIVGGREYQDIRFQEDKIIAAFAEELAQSSDHKKTIRQFGRKLDRLFEELMSGPFGWKERGEFTHYLEREDITKAYLLHLKPDWLDPDELEEYGTWIVLAMHLADEILRRREQEKSPVNALLAEAPLPMRAFAVLRLAGEFLAQQGGHSLIPDDEGVLKRYINFEFRWAAAAAVSEEGLSLAKAQDRANREADPDGKPKPLGTIYEEISNRLAAEYIEKNKPATVDDVPEEARSAILRENFRNRFTNELKTVIETGELGALIDRMMKIPEVQERFRQLTAPQPNEPMAITYQRLLKAGI